MKRLKSISREPFAGRVRFLQQSFRSDHQQTDSILAHRGHLESVIRHQRFGTILLRGIWEVSEGVTQGVQVYPSTGPVTIILRRHSGQPSPALLHLPAISISFKVWPLLAEDLLNHDWSLTQISPVGFTSLLLVWAIRQKQNNESVSIVKVVTVCF